MGLALENAARQRALKQETRERKLRSGVNSQGAVKAYNRAVYTYHLNYCLIFTAYKIYNCGRWSDNDGLIGFGL